MFLFPATIHKMLAQVPVRSMKNSHYPLPAVKPVSNREILLYYERLETDDAEPFGTSKV